MARYEHNIDITRREDEVIVLYYDKDEERGEIDIVPYPFGLRANKCSASLLLVDGALAPASSSRLALYFFAQQRANGELLK